MVKKYNWLIPLATLITYSIMVITNILANTLPINGVSTGEVSDSYPNLFAPAGITFAIWGVIYFLLFIYTIYQLIRYKSESDTNKQLLDKIGVLFSVSSIANILWIFAWHYYVVWLSLIMMIIILLCLININMTLKEKSTTLKEKFIIKLPFTVYFGWITVATIANVTTFLVYIDWDRLSLSEVFWTDLIIIVGAIIGIISILFFESLSYGLVLIWAYMGIAIKHLSPEGFDGSYPTVIITVFVSIFFILIAEGFLVQRKIRGL